MEQEPVMNLTVGEDREIAATRDNTSLFSFMGSLAMYNHVFVVTEAEQNQGMYIFSTSEAFSRIVNYMSENDYPAHINLREVAECDIDAFDQMVTKQAADDLEGGIPEDWQ